MIYIRRDIDDKLLIWSWTTTTHSLLTPKRETSCQKTK